ncbi:MAG: LPS export ABC transporter periplasmic protein LptC [Bacteroidales bacterium]|nr:LPS export ABC transporter periplasmic protein LptC [Bacteroidales bacterium]
MSAQRRYIKIIYAVLLTGTALLLSCEKKSEVLKELTIKELPSLSARNIETMYSDSGKVTIVVRSPLINQYTGGDEPHTLFPEGLTVLFYDKKTVPQASIYSKFARYTEKNKQWELRDSVVAVNTDGDILETELLYWSEPKESVWSDRFVRITGKDQIIMGTGFESDPRLTRWKIKNVSATIYIKNESKGTSGN